MDEVETVWAMDPIGFGVINVEPHIRSNPDRLYRADISADDFGIRVLVRHLEGS